MESIRIVIADDESLFRSGVNAILQRVGGFELAFECSNGEMLLSFLDQQQVFPDIVLMDLKMPVISGVDATKEITRRFPSVKVVALTSYYSAAYIHNMLQSGAAAFLGKDSTPELMLRTLFEVYRKGFYYSDHVLSFVHDSLRNYPVKVLSRFDKNFLTQRELDVLQLLCKQYSGSEIAKKMFISPRTVEGHRNNLLLKTGAKNILGLVIYALQNEIIGIDELTT